MGPSGRITHVIGYIAYIGLFGTGYAGIVFGQSSPYKGDSARFSEVVSDNPTSTRIPRVDGLSTDPRVLGRHNKFHLNLYG